MNDKHNLDYLNLGNMCVQIGETVELSTKIFKINKREKKQERIFLLTDMAIYNIKPMTDPIKISIKNNAIVCQRRIDLCDISSITMSTSSRQFTINIPTEYDYRYEAIDFYNQKEIITTIYNVHEAMLSTPLSVHRINQFSTAMFTVTKNDSQSVAFEKRNSVSQQPMMQFCSDVHNTCNNDSNTLVSPAPDCPAQPAKPPSAPQEKPSKAEPELEKIKTAADDIKCDLITAPYFADCVQVGTNKIDVKEYKVDHDHVVGMSLQYGATTSQINHIQTETKPMEATRYYDLLIHGYMRQIEQDLKLIPDDIKALCIAFHYKFLVYNEYCTVKYMKKFDAPRLLIESCPSKQNDSRNIPFGGRLVSRVPINTNHKLKVKIQMEDTFNNCHLENAEFVCVANNDYYASVTDELDLKEGDEYIIMQTSPSGWWYAMNVEGEDGWVPSNYLNRVDPDHGQLIFGVTTHPELFINTPLMEHPFKHVGAAHAMYTSRRDVMVEVRSGMTQINTHAHIPHCTAIKGALDVWIDDRVLKMGGLSGDLLTGDNGVTMKYYFAMAFTATDKKIISFEISGDFV